MNSNNLAILGLGSNLGDRFKNLDNAVNKLRSLVSDMSCSAIYESAALLPENAHESWNKQFLNMVVCGITEMPVEELLEHIKSIEYDLGRSVDHEAWSPREIDIDILAYDQKLIQCNTLNIPHNALLERDFFVIPMSEVVPKWKYPKAGKFFQKTIKEIEHILYSPMPNTLSRTKLNIS